MDDEQGIDDVREIAETFVKLGAELGGMGSADTVDAIARIAVERVPGARWASVTSYERGRFRTVAATDELVRRADAIQYAVGSGPCIDAIVDDTLYRPRDLRHDDRWPEFGRRVSEEVGMRSMLSYRLGRDVRDDGGDALDGLNIYSDEVGAFSERSELVGLMLATHGALAVALSGHEEKVGNLERALLTNREIGIAMGVLMAQHHVTRDQAFGLLRMASQNSNRKLHAVAVEVAETGALPAISGTRSRPARRAD